MIDEVALQQDVTCWWRDRPVDLARPQVVGVINVTSDSFYHGSRFPGVDAAVECAKTMVAQGAGALDFGAESSRPGAVQISESAEIDMLMPVLEAVLDAVDVPISVDTYKSRVAEAALKAGAHAINDIMGGRDAELLAVVAKYQAGLCIMHMQGFPHNMQHNPQYKDVVSEVLSWLSKQAISAEAAGIARNKIMLDPGIGFGKTLQHNSALLMATNQLVALGYPVWMGVSRKSMFDHMMGLSADDRLHASIGVSVMTALAGARFIRTHDVLETSQAIQACFGVQEHARSAHD